MNEYSWKRLSCLFGFDYLNCVIVKALSLLRVYLYNRENTKNAGLKKNGKSKTNQEDGQ